MWLETSWWKARAWQSSFSVQSNERVHFVVWVFICVNVEGAFVCQWALRSRSDSKLRSLSIFELTFGLDSAWESYTDWKHLFKAFRDRHQVSNSTTIQINIWFSETCLGSLVINSALPTTEVSCKPPMICNSIITRLSLQFAICIFYPSSSLMKCYWFMHALK